MRLSGIAVLALGLTVGCSGAHAEERGKESQFHFRVGKVSGSYSGPVSGTFSVSNSLDFEGEFFTAPKTSWTFRSILAHDLSAGRMMYAYAGVGHNWYLWSDRVKMDAPDGATSFSSIPRWRYYIGADIGISQAIVYTYSPVLQAVSVLIDFGGHCAVIYQVNRSFGIEGQFGYTMGFGFSSVSVGATTNRFLFGVSYYL